MHGCNDYQNTQISPFSTIAVTTATEADYSYDISSAACSGDPATTTGKFAYLGLLDMEG